MVVAFGPILDFANLVFVAVVICIFLNFSKSEFVVLIPIEFLHYIHKLPIFSQTVGDAARSGNNIFNNAFEHLFCFLGNVLGVAQISVDKA